jgi:methyl-accepting chemotaxis protein
MQTISDTVKELQFYYDSVKHVRIIRAVVQAADEQSKITAEVTNHLALLRACVQTLTEMIHQSELTQKEIEGLASVLQIQPPLELTQDWLTSVEQVAATVTGVR